MHLARKRQRISRVLLRQAVKRAVNAAVAVGGKAARFSARKFADKLPRLALFTFLQPFTLTSEILPSESGSGS